MSDPPLINRLRAAKAYADFTGHLPKTSYTVQLDGAPIAGYRLGPMVGVAYEATRDGITDQYFHRFSKHARPDLVVKDDGSQLYVVRGRYRVGQRGIQDMPPLMVVNPSSRPSLRRNQKGRFMPAARPHRRRRRRAGGAATLFARNPVGFHRVRRRRRRAGATSRRAPVVFKVNPTHRRRHVRRYRRNPIGGTGNLRIHQLIMPAAAIGVGAIGSELMMGYLPIPANLKTGAVRNLTKGVISLVAGGLIAKFMSRKIGEAFALGGMTIAFHDAGKDLILQMMPAAQFGAYMRPTPGRNMGYYSPGNQVPVRHMNMGLLPGRVNSPGGPSAFGLYTRFGGHASDGGPETRMGI
jgi:hypothetical protein